MMEEIGFSEWSDRLDITGSNHWLPAYGYQGGMQLGRGTEDNDGAAMLIAGQPQQFLFLETIVEETSDDLRSESDKSGGQAGWLDSDSDTGSVIHVPRNIGCCEWSGSERDLAVPKKRRRRTNHEDDDDDVASLSSRSSSLLQFENLEKHCEDVAVTLGALCEDSLDSDSLEETSDSEEDSDDASSGGTLHHSSWSSRDSGRIRSYRSFDSLNLLQQHKKQLSLVELSQSLNNDEFVLTSEGAYDKSTDLSVLVSVGGGGGETSTPPSNEDVDEHPADCGKEEPVIRTTQPQRSVENLSEDSGFGDHIPRLLSVHGHNIHNATIIEDEDSYSSSYDSDYSGGGGSSASGESEEGSDKSSRTTAESSTLLKLVENFKFMEGRGWDVEESKFNNSCWQSAPNLPTLQTVSSRVTSQGVASLPGSVDLCVETPPCEVYATSYNMSNRLPVRSTPNLTYSTDIESQHSLVRVPLKHFSLDEEDFDKEQNVSKSMTPLPTSGSTKGVHFCPVVSELSWRENYSEEETDDVTGSEDEDEGVREYDEDEEEEESTDSEGEAILLADSLVPEPADTTEASSPPTPLASHVVQQVCEVAPVVLPPAMEVHARPDSTAGPSPEPKKRTGRFGGFFQRFSFRRRRGDAIKKEPSPVRLKTIKPLKTTEAEYEDVTFIPLHPPTVPQVVEPDVVISSKPPLPPLPPRVVGASVKAPASRRVLLQQGLRPTPASSSMSGVVIDRAPRGAAATQHPTGLLETDLDTDITVSAPRPPLPKKARSLLNLGGGGQTMLKLPPGGGGVGDHHHHRTHHHHGAPTDHRAKSMEFLLDKENQAAVQPPENELQKIGAGERVMSEHQLRVQRSLQKLNVPDWYKNSVAGRPEGFRLKRDQQPTQHQGWPGLGSKTTSLSSLGSSQSAAARSPTGCHLLSPSPTPSPHVFTRWSTSRLNSTATSTSTSPCGSTRSSFNYRQPYLGWRSQERLSRPRTPAERLAAGIPQQLSPTKQQVPNLSEVRTSIKEVTSAIVHYVSGVRDGSGNDISHNEDSPSNRSPRWEGEWGSISRSSSPRGSGRLCWLESSFVGSRPLDSPETPLTSQVNKTVKALDTDNGVPGRISSGGELYLDFNNSKPQHQHHHTRVNGPDEVPLLQQEHDYDLQGEIDLELRKITQVLEVRNKPSPGSTTLEDVLDSLLGLPPTSRSPSPASSPRPQHPLPPRRSCGDLRADIAGLASDGVRSTTNLNEIPPYYVGDTLRRRSEGSDVGLHVAAKPAASSSRSARRVSFDIAANPETESVIRCRYSKCGRTASIAEARRNYKTCHNCAHVYCSRECRRAHWEKHRKTCLHSRVGALCRQVLATAKDDPATLRQISQIARRGYLAQGRGAVKSFFSCPELAERFVARGFSDLGEPAFVRWADLLPGEMGSELYSELVRLCKAYNPEKRLVLYIAVCVVSEVPTSGAVKWERQLVSRCAKLRLCRSLTTVLSQSMAMIPRKNSPNITRDMENPETLILTSLPGCHGQMPQQRSREISFSNIQRHLRQRGVSLRRHFPDVYKKLVMYTEGSADRFTPVTVYPRDATTGKTFMCIIMPDAEAEKLELVPKDSSRVQTIDISIEHEHVRSGD